MLSDKHIYLRHGYRIIEPLFPRGASGRVYPGLYILAQILPIVRPARMQIAQDPLLARQIAVRPDRTCLVVIPTNSTIPIQSTRQNNTNSYL